MVDDSGHWQLLVASHTRSPGKPMGFKLAKNG
jgi:hypothetical protein